MINTLIEKIIQNPLFLKLKDIIENGPYHDHKDVYSHSIKTKNIAFEQILSIFITNPKAKELFTKFTNETIQEMKKADLLVLTALLHDIGKMLYVKEDGNINPLIITNTEGFTSCPGHEYWGSTIVAEVIKDLTLPTEAVEYIANIIKLHDTFSAEYFAGKTNWPMNALINDVKSRAEGLYKEAMFNQYCDCFSAEPYKEAKGVVEEIFNEPSLYTPREYVIH